MHANTHTNIHDSNPRQWGDGSWVVDDEDADGGALKITRRGVCSRVCVRVCSCLRLARTIEAVAGRSPDSLQFRPESEIEIVSHGGCAARRVTCRIDRIELPFFSAFH